MAGGGVVAAYRDRAANAHALLGVAFALAAAGLVALVLWRLWTEVLGGVLPETIRAGAFLGAPCEWIDAPVSAWCRRTLRGRLVHIPQGEMLDSWKRNGRVCRECVLVAQAALAQVPHV
jgi:hypothetical protein